MAEIPNDAIQLQAMMKLADALKLTIGELLAAAGAAKIRVIPMEERS